MEENYLAVLSAYNHQEGCLNLALQGLIKAELASEGFNGNREHLITILYDENNNPYLLFNAKHLERVKEELKKRKIKAEGAFKSDDMGALVDSLYAEVHSEIQKIYTPTLLYGVSMD